MLTPRSYADSEDAVRRTCGNWTSYRLRGRARDLTPDHLDAAFDVRSRSFGLLSASKRDWWDALQQKYLKQRRCTDDDLVASYLSDDTPEVARALWSGVRSGSSLAQNAVAFSPGLGTIGFPA